MPSPILHSFAGYALYRRSKKREAGHNWKVVALCVILGNLPDFDMFPGLFNGKATAFHRGWTHSIGASLLCGVVVATTVWMWKRKDFARSFLLSSSVYFSHIVLDFFNSTKQGIPLFWPLDTSIYNFVWSRFLPISPFLRDAVSLETVGGVFEFVPWLISPQFIGVMCWELAVVFIAWAIIHRVREHQTGINVQTSQSVALVRALQGMVFFLFFLGSQL